MYTRIPNYYISLNRRRFKAKYCSTKVEQIVFKVNLCIFLESKYNDFLDNYVRFEQPFVGHLQYAGISDQRSQEINTICGSRVAISVH